MSKLVQEVWPRFCELYNRAGFVNGINIIFNRPLKEDSDIYGCYVEGSVLKGNAILVVNDDKLYRECDTAEALHYQTLVTIGHELAHAFADIIRAFNPFEDKSDKSFLNFDLYFGDEETFAETFGNCLATGDLMEYPYWQEFVPLFNTLVEATYRTR